MDILGVRGGRLAPLRENLLFRSGLLVRVQPVIRND
jgi:hypothetical protein